MAVMLALDSTAVSCTAVLCIAVLSSTSVLDGQTDAQSYAFKATVDSMTVAVDLHANVLHDIGQTKRIHMDLTMSCYDCGSA